MEPKEALATDTRPDHLRGRLYRLAIGDGRHTRTWQGIARQGLSLGVRIKRPATPSPLPAPPQPQIAPSASRGEEEREGGRGEGGQGSVEPTRALACMHACRHARISLTALNLWAFFGGRAPRRCTRHVAPRAKAAIPPLRSGAPPLRRIASLARPMPCCTGCSAEAVSASSNLINLLQGKARRREDKVHVWLVSTPFARCSGLCNTTLAHAHAHAGPGQHIHLLQAQALLPSPSPSQSQSRSHMHMQAGSKLPLYPCLTASPRHLSSKIDVGILPTTLLHLARQSA